MPIKKIVHLSDLHIGKDNPTICFKIIVESLKKTAKIIPDSTVIVITGDLAHDAKKKYYSEIIKPKLQELEDLNFKIIAVPGNHDFRRRKWSFKNHKLSNIKHFNRELLGCHDVRYPRVEYSGGASEPDKDRIAFILLDSMKGRFEKKTSFRGSGLRGKFGKSQLTDLDTNILTKIEKVRSSAKRVIVFHHHPFRGEPDRLDDEIELKRILNHHMDSGLSIDALLYGHNHKGCVNNEWHIMRCYDGSSSTGRKSKVTYPTFQRIIDLSSTDPTNDKSGNFHIGPDSSYGSHSPQPAVCD